MSEHPKNPPEAITTNEEQTAKQQEEKHQDQETKRLTEFQSRLSSDYLIYGDYQQEKGKKTLCNNKEFLEFIGTLNPAYTNFLNQLLEQNLQQANPDGKKGLKELASIFAEYERKLDSLHTKHSLSVTNDQEAIAALKIQPETETINYPEAKKLGLEVNIIRGSSAANRLIGEVANGTIAINTKTGQKTFVDQWKKECPNLPMPCVPPNNFWYLTQLSQNRIISNLEGTAQPVAPRFAKDEILFVDNWPEQDWNSPEAQSSHTSKLLKELLPPEAGRRHASTVNISRETIDNALWQNGDPVRRQPTPRHKKILEQLGCDPNQFELRLIRQDEYARLALAKDLGKKALWTNFDNYFLGDDGDRYGLGCGYRGYGGPSFVYCCWRGSAYGYLAVRLVLSRKQK